MKIVLKSILPFILTFWNYSHSQRDTTYKGKIYNYIEYFPNGGIKILGNVVENQRSGEWIFFKPNGRKLALGSFIDDSAQGRWKYWDYGRFRIFMWNWDDGNRPTTEMILKDGKWIIEQRTLWSNGRLRFYYNGERRKSISF